MGRGLRRARALCGTAYRHESVAGHAARSKLSCRVRQRRRHEARHEDGRTPGGRGRRGRRDRKTAPAVSHCASRKNRYRNVLFLEKEGFNDLLAAAEIAERFDLAIMSTKGYSSTAARTVGRGARRRSIFVLHDFDKDGLGICYTLHHDTIRYQFAQPPRDHRPRHSPWRMSVQKASRASRWRIAGIRAAHSDATERRGPRSTCSRRQASASSSTRSRPISSSAGWNASSWRIK